MKGRKSNKDNTMPKTFNGRPANLGSMYFEMKEGISRTKYCVGYCESCGDKMGLSNQELKEMAMHLPNSRIAFLSKLLRMRIIFPS